MSYSSKFEQPSIYQPQSWPPRPHARFANIPQGLIVLGRITTWQDPLLAVSASSKAETAAVAAQTRVVVDESLPAVIFAAEDLPESAAFFEQELESLREIAAANHLPADGDSLLESAQIAANLAQAPQYQPAIRDAVQRRAKSLRAHKTLVTQWHLAGNSTVLNRLPSLHLWAMAGCWGHLRDEKLVVIDATNSGPDLAQLLGWDCESGWSDLLLDRATLSKTLHKTPWPNVTLIPRGASSVELTTDFTDDAILRQASALSALQRDHRAVWILTAGVWDDAAQITSQHAGERQLIVPLNCPAREWHDLNSKLVAGNVLINGWVALNPSAEQRRAA